MTKFFFILIFLTLPFSGGASTLEEINKYLSDWDKISDFSVLGYNSFDAINYDFSGIVRLRNCSASVVKLKNSNNQQALLLTNGHCLRRFQRPGEVIFNKKYKVSVELMNKSAEVIGTIYTTKIHYATMTRTDMALIELDHTYQELENIYNVKPLPLATRPPEVGEPIEIISGFWRRGFSCAVKNIVYNLKEGEWDFYDSIGYTKNCKVYGGTSGAPVISLNTREVVAVNNTGNSSGQHCTLNNPCEVNEAGTVTVIKDKGYAQNTFWVYDCLATTSKESIAFDFKKQSCQLLAPAL